MPKINLQSIAKELFRIGIVKSTNPEKGTVRVEIADVTDHNGKALQSFDLPVIVSKSKKDKAYDMPDLEEQVLCLFLGNGLSKGFCLGSFFQDVDTPPVNCQDKFHRSFEDGTWLEYDRAEHKLTADVKGDIVINATGKVNVAAQGNVTVSGERIDLN